MESPRRIQESFEKRYYVNFFDNLFEGFSVGLFLSKYGIEQIATLGKKSEKAPMIDGVVGEMQDNNETLESK